MNIGESTITVADHPTLGPVRVDVFQPRTLAPKREETPTEVLLAQLVREARATRIIVESIYNHLTRPPWWTRFYLWVKRHVASK